MAKISSKQSNYINVLELLNVKDTLILARDSSCSSRILDPPFPLVHNNSVN